MKIGVGTFPTEHGLTVHASQLAERLGFDWFTLTDSPLYEDCYIHLGIAAAATERISLGPAVTSAVARHPVLVASALATLSEISNGRIRAAVGTGNSMARGLGLEPATLAALEDTVNLVKRYMSGSGDADAKGIRLDRRRTARRAEVFVAADGPKGAKVATRCGDGWLLGNGLDAEYRRALFHAAGTGEGAPPFRWWVSGAASTADSLDEVLDIVGGLVIGMAMRAFRSESAVAGIPPHLRNELAEFVQKYNYGHHGDRVSPNWSLLSNELRSVFCSRLCIWGNEDQWAKTLLTLDKEGAEGILLFVDHRRPLEGIRDVATRLQRLGRLEQHA